MVAIVSFKLSRDTGSCVHVYPPAGDTVGAGDAHGDREDTAGRCECLLLSFGHFGGFGFFGLFELFGFLGGFGLASYGLAPFRCVSFGLFGLARLVCFRAANPE